MTWDDDQEVNPGTDEGEMTPDEWEAMVADQKGRIPYGPVADRPDAGDASDGDVWLVTDLGSNGGVVTELVSGSWEIKGVGDASNPVPNVHATSVTTEHTGTDVLEYDFTETWPNYPQMPSAAGVTALRPHQNVENPVITKADVDDASPNGGIADQFFCYENGTVYLIAELIGAGPSNENTLGAWEMHTPGDWTYLGQVLDETDYADYAYSHTLKYGGEWYMTPTNGTEDFQIYRATNFPLDWELAETPLTNAELGLSGTLAEPTVWRWNERWWLSVNDHDSDNEQYLHYTEKTGGGLVGRSWSAHDLNPVHTKAGEPAAGQSPRLQGRAMVREDHIDIWKRPNISLYRITELTPSTFEMKRLGDTHIVTTQPGTWGSNNIHHVDVMPARDGRNSLVAIDGNDGTDYHVGIYTITDHMDPAGQVGLSSNQSVPDSSSASISMDTARVRVPSIDAFDDTQEITVNSSGHYEVGGQLTFSSPSATPFTGFVRIRNMKTGDSVVIHRFEIQESGEVSITIPRTLCVASAGDWFEMQVFQSSGTSQTVDGTPSQTFFSVRKQWGL